MKRVFVGKGDVCNFDDPDNWEPRGSPESGDSLDLPLDFGVPTADLGDRRFESIIWNRRPQENSTPKSRPMYHTD